MTVSGESSKTRSDIEADATQPSVRMSEPTRHHSPDPRAMLWVRVDPLGNTTFALARRMMQSKTETTRAWRLFRSRRCQSCRGLGLWPARPRTALFMSTSGRTKRRRARASAGLVYKTLVGKGLRRQSHRSSDRTRPSARDRPYARTPLSASHTKRSLAIG